MTCGCAAKSAGAAEGGARDAAEELRQAAAAIRASVSAQHEVCCLLQMMFGHHVVWKVTLHLEPR